MQNSPELETHSFSGLVTNRRIFLWFVGAIPSQTLAVLYQPLIQGRLSTPAAVLNRADPNDTRRRAAFPIRRAAHPEPCGLALRQALSMTAYVSQVSGIGRG